MGPGKSDSPGLRLGNAFLPGRKLLFMPASPDKRKAS